MVITNLVRWNEEVGYHKHLDFKWNSWLGVYATILPDEYFTTITVSQDREILAWLEWRFYF